MSDDESPRSASRSDVDEWDRLLLEQTALFKKTTSRNKVLETRLDELERELSVWKIALKAADEEKEAFRKKVSRLERSIGSLKEDNPLILCLIDGDGNIFSQDLIQQGATGARHAAMRLTQGLNEHMATVDDASAGRGQVWLTVYCNKKGLTETLTSNKVCTAEQFEEFVRGFNQASPLFSFVDVGFGKEAADSKIKECLRVFTRFPQTTRVFFGGAHDNGYTSTLNYLENEGLINKLTILRGYKDLAYELKSLNLPHLEIEGVFMTRKLLNLNTHNNNKNVKAESSNVQRDVEPFPLRTGVAMLMPEDEQTQRPRTNTYNTLNTSNRTPEVSAGRQLMPNTPLHKQKPPPCNFHYLSTCRHGNNCRYAHDYILSFANVEELRKNAKQWPCPYLNSDRPCTYGNQCPMAHTCPKGAKCSFAKAKKCKFTGAGMHGTPRAAKGSSKGRESTPPSVRSPSPASSYSFLPMSPTPSPRKASHKDWTGPLREESSSESSSPRGSGSDHNVGKPYEWF